MAGLCLAGARLLGPRVPRMALAPDPRSLGPRVAGVLGPRTMTEGLLVRGTHGAPGGLLGPCGGPGRARGCTPPLDPGVRGCCTLYSTRTHSCGLLGLEQVRPGRARSAVTAPSRRRGRWSPSAAGCRPPGWTSSCCSGTGQGWCRCLNLLGLMLGP